MSESRIHGLVRDRLACRVRLRPRSLENILGPSRPRDSWHWGTGLNFIEIRKELGKLAFS